MAQLLPSLEAQISKFSDFQEAFGKGRNISYLPSLSHSPQKALIGVLKLWKPFPVFSKIHNLQTINLSPTSPTVSLFPFKRTFKKILRI
jgi:hypothetical protein